MLTSFLSSIHYFVNDFFIHKERKPTRSSSISTQMMNVNKKYVVILKTTATAKQWKMRKLMIPPGHQMNVMMMPTISWEMTIQTNVNQSRHFISIYRSWYIFIPISVLLFMQCSKIILKTSS